MASMLGEIKQFAGSYTPENFEKCDGRLLPIEGNRPLFAILGTRYGGDGVNDFALPDLSGRIPIGGWQVSRVVYSEGDTGGSSSVNIGVNNLPNHEHNVTINTKIPAYSGTANEVNPSNTTVLATGGESVNRSFIPHLSYSDATPDIEMPGVSITTTTTEVGEGAPINTMPPFLVVNYIICVKGEFPEDKS